ncbi:MAG: DUF3489 domain-containing protein [Rubrivivax sp.]
MSTNTTRAAKPVDLSSAATPAAGAQKPQIGTGKRVSIPSNDLPKSAKVTNRAPEKSSTRSTRRAPAAPVSLAPPAPASSKQSRLIDLLKSTKGGTIDQMTQITGWQPHTVRGTISGALRKRLGLNVTCTAAVDGGARVYRIVEAAIR